jgi:peptide/nickel transport system substrate-binding protein
VFSLCEMANWFPTVTRGAYKIGLNTTPSSVDDPDQQFYENYACGSENNVTKYCNPDLQKLFDQQSIEADQDKRKRLVWEIDKRLQEDQARPIIYHLRGGTCWHPHVRGVTIMVNSCSTVGGSRTYGYPGKQEANSLTGERARSNRKGRLAGRP